MELPYQATFHFHEELNDFLPRKQRGLPVLHEFGWRASVKDMIEALGVPHSEIEALSVNGVGTTFEHIVEDGDVFEIWPRAETSKVVEKVRLRPPVPDPPCFILDIHLGRLTAYLRMMGYDAAYGEPWVSTEFPDEELAQVAADEGRILLTRDIGLLKRGIVTWGYWIRSTKPRDKLAEVVKRFNLAKRAFEVKRCMKCNGLLKPVDKRSVKDYLQPDTAAYFDEFQQCQQCQQIYWKGSHYDRIKTIIEEILNSDSERPY